MKVVWSPLALQKLSDAAEFISLDNHLTIVQDLAWAYECPTKEA